MSQRPPTARCSVNWTYEVLALLPSANGYPILGAPNLSIDSANFGQIPTNQITGNRKFQGQLRLTFWFRSD